MCICWLCRATELHCDVESRQKDLYCVKKELEELKTQLADKEAQLAQSRSTGDVQSKQTAALKEEMKAQAQAAQQASIDCLALVGCSCSRQSMWLNMSLQYVCLGCIVTILFSESGSPV